MVIIRYKPLKTGKYSVFLDINNNGKRSYEYLKIYTLNDYNQVKKIDGQDFFNMQKAEQVRSKRHLEIIDGNHGITVKKTENIDFLKFVKTKSVNNDDQHAKALYNHLSDYTTELRINDLTFIWITDFLKNLRLKLNANTTRCYASRLKYLLDLAVKEGIIKDHHFKGIAVPKQQKVERECLTIEEVRKLEESKVKFNIQIKQAFIFSCFSGLRISDIYRLKWSNVHNGIITYKPQKTEKNSNKTISFQLPLGAMKVLSEVEKGGDLIFWKLPKDSAVSKHLRVWGLEIQIGKHLHFHLARHSFATIGITAGIDIYTMMQLLGHSKIEMTQIYAKIVDQKKNVEVLKFPGL